MYFMYSLLPWGDQSFSMLMVEIPTKTVLHQLVFLALVFNLDKREKNYLMDALNLSSLSTCACFQTVPVAILFSFYSVTLFNSCVYISMSKLLLQSKFFTGLRSLALVQRRLEVANQLGFHIVAANSYVGQLRCSNCLSFYFKGHCFSVSCTGCPPAVLQLIRGAAAIFEVKAAANN